MKSFHKVSVCVLNLILSCPEIVHFSREKETSGKHGKILATSKVQGTKKAASTI